MSTPSVTRLQVPAPAPSRAPARASAFDPFGEPVAEGVACAGPSAGDRAARRIGGAVFWSLALLILAGRIYAADLPVAQTVAAQISHVAQVVALR